MNISRGLALIVANSGYVYCNPLPSCEKDGVAVKESLEHLGFDIITALDSNRDNLYKIMDDFIIVADSYSTVLLYYSGHGIQIDGENYIVPIDCIPIDNKVRLINTGLVDLNMITDYMNNHAEKTNILILDACRTAPAFTKSIFSGGLSQINAGSGTFISFATAPNTVAIGSSSSLENSVFTKCLLNHIEKPNIKIEDMFKLVRNDVERITGGTQSPWESTSLKSDFYFNIMENDDINEKIYKSLRDNYTATTIIELSAFFRKPASDILRIYMQQKSEKPGGIYFKDNDELEIYLLHVILEFGFEFKHYRWIYNNTTVIMGEFNHNPANIAFEPIIGQEINVNYKIDFPLYNSKSGCIISGSTTLPPETHLMITLENMDLSYSAQCKIIVTNNNEFTSRPFTLKGDVIPVGEYKIIISMPISSVQPKNVQTLIGIKGQNLTGEYVTTTIINGKTADFQQVVSIITQ